MVPYLHVKIQEKNQVMYPIPYVFWQYNQPDDEFSHNHCSRIDDYNIVNDYLNKARVEVIYVRKFVRAVIVIDLR